MPYKLAKLAKHLKEQTDVSLQDKKHEQCSHAFTSRFSEHLQRFCKHILSW